MKCRYCSTENPNSANFCRICGKKLDSRTWDLLLDYVLNKIDSSKRTIKNLFMVDADVREFTLDKFKTISLQPISIVNIKFVNKILLFVVLLLASISLAFYNSSDLRYLIKDECGSDVYRAADLLMPFVNILICILCIVLLWSFWKKLLYWLNADYIENRFVGDLSRIAKNCKLGIFNDKNKRVVLASRYDNIEKFDTDHLLIQRKGKKGIFSIKKSKIIIPVSYDNISAFSNSVATAVSGSKTVHYDIKGNKLR